MEYNIVPNLIKSDIEYFAIVMPENTYGKIAVKYFADAINKITVNLFEDLLTAKEWILNY